MQKYLLRAHFCRVNKELRMTTTSNRILINKMVASFLRETGIKRNKLAALCKISRQTFDYRLTHGGHSQVANLIIRLTDTIHAIGQSCNRFATLLNYEGKNARTRKTRRLRNRAT